MNVINLSPKGEPLQFQVQEYSDSDVEYIRIMGMHNSTVCNIGNLDNPKRLGEQIASAMSEARDQGYKMAFKDLRDFIGAASK